jgi:hypothetical protein
MKLRKSIRFGIALLLLLAGYGFWYLGTYSMGVATAYQVNSPLLDKHLLIVTQQSAYKDSLTAGIVRSLRDQPVHIKVIDLTTAAGYQPDWEVDACILMHTWEMSRPPGMVYAFRDSLGGEVPLLVITTSGGGEEILDDEIDGISSASEIDNSERDIRQAVTWAKYALGLKPLDFREKPEVPAKTQAGRIIPDTD